MPRTLVALSLLTLTLIILPRVAHAQVDSARVQRTRTLLERLQPGTRLRVDTGQTRVVGPFQRVEAGALYLENGTIPLRSVNDIFVRKRATVRGLKIGALIGAPVGALSFTTLLAFVAAFCEYECEDFNAGSVAKFALNGAALGALIGGTAGSIVGASTTHWSRLTTTTRSPTGGM